MTDTDTLDAIEASIKRSSPGIDAATIIAPLRRRTEGGEGAKAALELLLIDFAALGILTAYKAGLAAHAAKQAEAGT